jgi:hypothetical protein
MLLVLLGPPSHFTLWHTDMEVPVTEIPDRIFIMNLENLLCVMLAPVSQSPESRRLRSAWEQILPNLCSKLRTPHRGTFLGPFVCGANK